MSDFQYPCDYCGELTEQTDRVDQYVVNVHDFSFERQNDLCPLCAKQEERSRTSGHAEVRALQAINEMMYGHYGEPVTVKWLQGDEHKILVHVRRISS